MKYVFYSDPGHGWLAVSKRELLALNIAEKISGCSYQSKTLAYLEEDCDMGVFLHAKFRASVVPSDWRGELKVKNKWTNNRHRIRQLESYAIVKQ